MSELPKALPKSVITWLRAGASVPRPADVAATISGKANPGAAQVSQTAHPDANLLSAFVEQSLTTDERSQVVEHLSRCSECRDLVALSLPELQPAEIITHLVADRRPFWSGKLAWGAVAASFVVVGAAVLLQYQAKMPPATAELSSYSKSAPSAPRQEESIADKDEVVGNVAQTRTSNDKLAAKVAPPSSTVKEDRELAKKFPAQQRNAGLIASKEKTNAALPSAEADRREQPGNQNALSAPAPRPRKAEAQLATPPTVAESKAPAENGPAPTKVPAASATPNAAVDAVVSSARVGGNITAAAQASADAAPQNGPASAQQTTVEVQGENPKVQTESSTASGGQLETTLAKSHNVPRFRWTLSSGGAVLRSANRGRTWQSVPLHDNANFRALTSVGADVWVGGAHGTLYHSADSGNTWQRLNPAANGSPLIDDIVALDFKDAQQGRLTTAAGEIWITSDGGQTWHKAE